MIVYLNNKDKNSEKQAFRKVVTT